MKQKVVSIGDINVANDLPFVLFGGMNVLESRDLAMRICEHYVLSLIHISEPTRLGMISYAVFCLKKKNKKKNKNNRFTR